MFTTEKQEPKLNIIILREILLTKVSTYSGPTMYCGKIKIVRPPLTLGEKLPRLFLSSIDVDSYIMCFLMTKQGIGS